MRQTESGLVLTELRAWLMEMLRKIVPRSPLGKALAYLDRHWAGLVRYCEASRLEIDSSRRENANGNPVLPYPRRLG